MVGTKCLSPAPFQWQLCPGVHSSLASIVQCSLHCPDRQQPRGKGAETSPTWERSSIQKPKDFLKPGNGIPTYDERAHWAIETMFVWKEIILNNLGM